MSTIISEEIERKISHLLNKFKLIPIVSFFIFLAFFALFFNSLAQQSVLAVQSYQLPYPGILPNHPLYGVKVLRDQMMEFFTRDSLKKAELDLLFADKRIGMAQSIREQDWALTETTASKAEKYLLKVQQNLVAAKNIGLTPTVSFVTKVKHAAGAHNKILRSLKASAPKKFKPGLAVSIALNEGFSRFVNGL